MTRTMAFLFALGATCFVVAPVPAFADLVGERADAITFFAGSLLFTAGGAVQVWLARHDGRAARWTAGVQSAGTLFFNVSTWRALDTALSSAGYDRLVWRPDALGSICFLVSGVIGYVASPRRGWRPARGAADWWMPAVNLAGCVLFGIAAVAGYVLPATGSELAADAAAWTTTAGAACFLACALGTLRRSVPGAGLDPPAVDLVEPALGVERPAGVLDVARER